MPDDLRGQFSLVRQILAVHRIPVVELEGAEADDVIATLARQAEDGRANVGRYRRLDYCNSSTNKRRFSRRDAGLPSSGGTTPLRCGNDSIWSRTSLPITGDLKATRPITFRVFPASARKPRSNSFGRRVRSTN